jgi:RimJ/RimL family protein N-acetyltransferase
MADTLALLAPIATARLRLCVLSDADAEAIRRATDHPEVTRRVDFLEGPFTLEDAAALVARNRGSTERMFGIRTSDGDALIGIIGAHLQGEHAVEIGYWLDPEFHRQGYAGEAVAGLIDALRSTLPQRRIVAECDPDNAASWRVLTRAGFEATGEPGHRPGRRLLALGTGCSAAG